MLLIRPRVGHRDWFGFAHHEEMIRAGYEAASWALDQLDGPLHLSRGIHPRRRIQLSVNRDKCIGCSVCVALAPGIMKLDADRKAYAAIPEHDWSPADGEFVENCPTEAITAESLATGRRTTRPISLATIDL